MKKLLILWAASSSAAITERNPYSSGQIQTAYGTSSVGIVSSSGYSVSYDEEKIVCIPSYSAKRIFEYEINSNYIVHCDLPKYPTRKKIKTITFDKSTTPVAFMNKLSYSLGQSTELVRVENDFFVSEVTNYPEIEIRKNTSYEFCGKKRTAIVNKEEAPDRFYIRYTSTSK